MAFVGVAKNSSLAVCFSSFSLSFFLLSPSCFLLLGLAFSKMLVPWPARQLTEAYVVALSMKGKTNFPPGKARTGLPVVWMLFFVCTSLPFFLPLPDLLSYIYNQRLTSKGSGNCWPFRPAQLMSLFMECCLGEFPEDH